MKPGIKKDESHPNECDHYAIAISKGGLTINCTACSASWRSSDGSCITSKIKNPELRIKYGAD